MYEELRNRVYKANMALPHHKLVVFTWGNVSEIDRENGVVAIKPSGVNYENLTPEAIIVVDLEGNKLYGELNPSSDTETHLELYRKFKNIGGITHTHSRWATVYAQAGKSIKPYGTTHGDYFYGAVPCTRKMTAEEISGKYEYETGRVIVETFERSQINPIKIPACLVNSHGPFTWGKNADSSVYNAVVLEELAFMAWHTEQLNGGDTPQMQQELLDKHFLRKHGDNAYYGQK